MYKIKIPWISLACLLVVVCSVIFQQQSGPRSPASVSVKRIPKDPKQKFVSRFTKVYSTIAHKVKSATSFLN